MSRTNQLIRATRRHSRAAVRSSAAGALAIAVAISGVQAASSSAAAEPVYSLLGSAIPSVQSDPDRVSVELGLRFSASVSGSITGVRFYKGAGNAGTHTGKLWSSAGARLAAATFVNESARGWQTVKFAKPVAVSAGSTYVASYVAPRGGYAADEGFFSRPMTTGHLTAPANAGVYRYGSGGFPTLSYKASNYYVDVLFTPTSTGTTPMPAPSPAVAAPSPAVAPLVPVTSPVTYGWEINSNNTGLAGAGVVRSSLPIFAGPVTSGMTLSRVKITSTLDLTSVPNVTLDRVWVAPTSGRNGVILGAGTVIKDSDIDGSGLVQGERIGIYGNTSGSYAISRVAITNVSIGAWLDGDGSGSLTDGYILTSSINGAHQDGFTRRAGVGALAITRMRIDSSGPSVTGAFFIANTWGGRIGGVALKDSYLEGEGYVMAIYNNGPGTAVGIDNVRVRSTGWGPITSEGLITYTAWNNVRAYDGSRLPLADGALIIK